MRLARDIRDIEKPFYSEAVDFIAEFREVRQPWLSDPQRAIGHCLEQLSKHDCKLNIAVQIGFKGQGS